MHVVHGNQLAHFCSFNVNDIFFNFFHRVVKNKIYMYLSDLIETRSYIRHIFQKIPEIKFICCA